MCDKGPLQQSEPIPSGGPFDWGLERDWCLVQHGPSNASSHRRAALVAFLAVLTWSAGIAGCNRSGAAANPTAKTNKEPAVLSPPVTPDPRTDEAAVATAPEALPAYVLPFEARANPFAPPELMANDPTSTSGSMQPAEVKLIGLMSNGTGSMAVIEVNGKERVVNAGTRFESSSGPQGLRIVEIRESDILVEQTGRRWVVPLPTP